MISLKPELDRIPAIKYSYNIGALMDISTGKYETGIYGESILNGGLANITGVVGIGNNFKSTILHFMQLTAMGRMENSTANTYDTEINITENRLKQLAANVYELNNEDVIDTERWIVTDKTKYYGNEWFEKIKEFMEYKIKNAGSITVTTPFLDRDGKSLLKMLIPTFTEIDSFTKFDTKKSNEIQDDNELGDSGANTLYMNEGQAKKRLLNQLPKPIQLSNNYFLMSAHIGKDIPMDPRAAPIKKLQFLKNNDVIKGVTNDFTFLTTNCWQCQNATPLINDSTKGPEYPRDPQDNMKGDTDLFIVTLISLRSKVGPSGLITQMIVSQQEGVKPGLTEFHYIKLNERFGLDGSLQNYNLDLLPEVKLSRTTVRGKLESYYKLRIAINITAELCQMTYLLHDLPDGLICTPKELYEDIKKLGYDWDMILSKTRGWWTYNNDKQPLLFLSTMDLLKMRRGEYSPFWLDENKQIKKSFLIEEKKTK